MTISICSEHQTRDPDCPRCNCEVSSPPEDWDHDGKISDILWEYEKGRLGFGECVNKLEEYILSHEQKNGEAIENKISTIKRAFGNCEKCYGKGYSTQIFGVSGSDDFGHEGYESPIKNHMVFCSCSRGKNLQELIESRYCGTR